MTSRYIFPAYRVKVIPHLHDQQGQMVLVRNDRQKKKPNKQNKKAQKKTNNKTFYKTNPLPTSGFLRVW